MHTVLGHSTALCSLLRSYFKMASDRAKYKTTYRVLNVWAQHFFVKVLRHRFPGTKCGQPTLFFFFILLVYSFSERVFKTFACSKENNRKKILQNCESLVTLWHHIQVTVVKISCSLGILTLSRTIFFPFVHFSSLQLTPANYFFGGFQLVLFSELSSQTFSKPRVMLDQTTKTSFPWRCPCICTLGDHEQRPITVRVTF